MELFLQTLIDGLLIGGLIIVVGIGFSLCFGVMHIVDFAVGEWIMLGAYVAYIFVRYLGYDPMIYLPIIFLIFSACGYLLYPLIYRAVSGKRHNPVLMGLVFTFGISILAKGGALSIWGYHIQSITTWLSGKSISMGVVTVPSLRFSSFVFGILVTILFMIFLYRTKFGVIIRATAQDRDMANLLGADVRKVGATVYSLYAGITGMSGVLIGALFSIHAAMGAKYCTLAFFVGVYIGGLYNLVALFMVMYGVLLITPKGILRRGI